jgi:uncharacterized protein (DUF1330 family)
VAAGEIGLLALGSPQSGDDHENSYVTLTIAMLVGAGLGAAAVDGLRAQGKGPGAYAIIDISEINNPDLFKTLLPKTAASNAAFGGQNVALTENIVAVDGTPPKRFVIISFDSMDKAKAWSKSPAQEEITGIRTKSTKSRAFIVDGTLP